MSELYNDLNLTVFPQNVDQFLTFLNITATDGPLIAQYQTALQAGNSTLANQILAQIPSGTQKIIKATDLNKLTQAILAVERFYKTDIEPYIEDKQTEWLSIINQFSYKGVWSIGTSYQINNLVTYTTSGITFVYLATSTPPVGAVPTNTQYWRLLTIQGQPGPSGAGLSYRQEWNVSTQYQTNNAVTYDGTIWMSLQFNTGVQPGTNQSIWKQIITLETATYPIQSTEPQGMQQGDLWFNTQNNPTNYYYLEPLTNPISQEMIPIGYQTYGEDGKILNGTGPLPISSGGTGASTASQALTNLGAASLVNGQVPYVQTPHLTSSKNFYVDAAQGDDTNTGAQSAPFRTIQAALDAAPKDLGGKGLTILLAPGEYDEVVDITGFFNRGTYNYLEIRGATNPGSGYPEATHRVKSIIVGQNACVVSLVGLWIYGENGFGRAVSLNTPGVKMTYCTVKNEEGASQGIIAGYYGNTLVTLKNVAVDGYSQTGIGADGACVMAVHDANITNNGVGLSAAVSAGGAFVTVYKVTYSGNTVDTRQSYGGQIFGG